MRPAILLVLVLSTGCASAGAPATASGTATHPEVLTDEHGNVIRTTDAAAAISINASPAEVLRAVAVGFEAAGIPADVVDPAQQIVARSSITVSRQLKGERLSAFFDCGQGQFGPRADDGRVTMAVTSRVIGSAAPVTVTTRIEASLMPNGGASSSRIRCGSRGILEERIRREAFRQLGLTEPARE